MQEDLKFSEEEKAAIKKRMIKHLEHFGYPECHPIIVMEELETMHNILIEEKLFPYFIPFEIFKTVAIQEFLKAQAASFGGL